MSIAQDLANALHRFNAKERNFLMRFALLGDDSGPRSAAARWVHPTFFEALKVALESSPTQYGAKSQIKLNEGAKCIYAAMDYHLEWLHAALWSVGRSDPKFNACPIARHPEESTADQAKQFDVMGNQEDADLVLVIEDGDHTYLVLVEAKGDSSFSRSQLASKLARLRLILDRDHVSPRNELTFALVLLAPVDKLTLGGHATFPALAEFPSALEVGEGEAMRNPPERLGELILRMPMPNFPDEVDLVTRCDKDGENREGSSHESRKESLTHWKVAARRRMKAKQR